jgi:DNA replication protein DnaC
VLRALFAQEAAGRERSALATRRTAAGLPTGKTFDSWSPESSSIPALTQHALRTLEWVHRRENLVLCGPSGTGKTFLLEALGQHAVQEGRRVAWFTLEDLGMLLRRHRTDDTVTKAITRVLRADLVVVDDTGPLPVATDAAEGLYRLVDTAYEKRSVAIYSNLHPRTARRTCGKFSCVRRARAQAPRHRDRRPAAAPGPHLPNHRRQRAPVPSPRRPRSESVELNTRPMTVSTRQIPWPSPGRSRDHHRAGFTTAPGAETNGP